MDQLSRGIYDRREAAGAQLELHSADMRMHDLASRAAVDHGPEAALALLSFLLI